MPHQITYMHTYIHASSEESCACASVSVSASDLGCREPLSARAAHQALDAPRCHTLHRLQNRLFSSHRCPRFFSSSTAGVYIKAGGLARWCIALSSLLERLHIYTQYFGSCINPASSPANRDLHTAVGSCLMQYYSDTAACRASLTVRQLQVILPAVV